MNACTTIYPNKIQNSSPFLILARGARKYDNPQRSTVTFEHFV